MLKKPQNCPISDFFNLTPKYFLPLLPYTDLVPPSTDPVPPSTNWYWPSTIMDQPPRLILIHCHHVPTSRAPYWPSTIMYQPATQYHQVPTGTVIYWPSTQLHHFEPTGSFRQKIKPYSMLSFFTPSLYSRVFMIVLYALIIAVAGQITSTLIIGSCNYLQQTSPLIIFVQLNWWAFQLWAIPLWCLQ